MVVLGATMKTSRYVLALALGLLVLAAPRIAQADTVFNVTGTFGDNSTLSGTLTINTSTGLVDAADLAVQYNITPTVTEMFANILGQTPNSVTLEGDHFSDLFVYINASTLTGFMRGTLCSTSVTCTGGVVSEVSTSTGIHGVPFNDFLTGGMVTAPTTAPEPSTIVLLGVTLLSLALAVSRKRIA
jgi:hypothetical protein